MAALTIADLNPESFSTKADTSDENIDITMSSEEALSSPDKSITSAPDSEGYHSRVSDSEQTRTNNNDSSKLDNNDTMGSLTHKLVEVNEPNGSDYDSGTERNIDDEYDRKSASPQSKTSGDDSAHYNWYSTAEAKKARVENIITSMRHYPTDYSLENTSQASLEKGRKRKQYHPQQHDTTGQHMKQPNTENVFLHAQIRDLHNKLQFIHSRMYNEEAENDLSSRPYYDNLASRSMLFGMTNHNPVSQSSKPMTDSLSPGKLTAESYEQFKINNKETPCAYSPASTISQNTVETKCSSMPPRKKFKFSEDMQDFEELCSDLKKRISRAINSVVDEFTSDFAEYKKGMQEELRKAKESKNETRSEKSFDNRAYNFPFYSRPDDSTGNRFLDNPLRNLVDSLSRNQIHHPLASYPQFPAYYRYLPTLPPAMMPPPPPPFTSQASAPLPPEPEQTEALSLVVGTPKKKRTKVTDTRLSPRAARALLQDGFAQDQFSADSRSVNDYQHPGITHCLPTSVAITNPSLQHSDYLRYMKDDSPFNDSSSRSGKQSPLQADQGSPGASNVTSSECARLSNRKLSHFDNTPTEPSPFYPHLPMQYTNTLTPMHLRKAKLMFFYVRYPSSSILKTYFPDVQFNKNNTAQLVKWFSNFREFFYIQMEKYARQAIAEGVKNPADITVSADAEIYRVLNLHYNRNNQLEVPDKFRQVLEVSLREFFVAILNGKDSEQPWKKSIYKVIQRLDDKLPEFFLSPNWMELLGEA